MKRPHLVPRRLAAALFTALLGTSAVSASGFSGPLFGLTTGPTGELLVADTGAGVVTQDGSPIAMPPLPGITDIGVLGKSSLWITRTGTEPTQDTGQGVYRLSKGKLRKIVDLYAFELANNPHPGDATESNPFDVQPLAGGNTALVVDSAGNDLLRVDTEGKVDVLAVFPNALASTATASAAPGMDGWARHHSTSSPASCR